jgi:hypothetical protein
LITGKRPNNINSFYSNGYGITYMQLTQQVGVSDDAGQEKLGDFFLPQLPK